MSPTTTKRRWLLVALTLVFGLAGCGGAASTSSTDQPSPSATAFAAPSEGAGAPSEGAAEAFPVTVTAANGEVTITDEPRAIVSLSPTATETLFAIDAGDQVTAVDEYSNYPAEAPITDLSGFEPNVEAIAGYDPDLVVIADDGADLTGALGALDIPVLHAPPAATLDDAYDQMLLLGEATGHAAEAEALTEQMRGDIDKIVADLPERDRPISYYHELDPTYYTVTADTFIGEVYSLLGLESIADAADDAAGGYPQLSEEFILDADPDVILLADTKCCEQSVQTVAERPGWSDISAVRDDAVVELDDDIASRWGPRTIDLVREVAAEVVSVAGP